MRDIVVADGHTIKYRLPPEEGKKRGARGELRAGEVVKAWMLSERSIASLLADGWLKVVSIDDPPPAPKPGFARVPDKQIVKKRPEATGNVAFDYDPDELRAAINLMDGDEARLFYLNAMIADRNEKIIDEDQKAPLAEKVEDAIVILSVDFEE